MLTPVTIVVIVLTLLAVGVSATPTPLHATFNNVSPRSHHVRRPLESRSGLLSRSGSRKARAHP